MPISQNARFTGPASVDREFEHPPGASIARRLSEGLANRGWVASEIDNWRDSGWSIRCGRGASTLELTVAKGAEDDEWFLQIAPAYVPGIIGRLRNKPASATPDDIHALAMDTHDTLTASGRFGGFMWQWDGPPDATTSTPTPTPAVAKSERSDAADS
jgi:hypothetical protein